MKNHIYKRGFTLIEALVAIGIFLMAVTGPMVLIHKSVSVSQQAKYQTVAIGLAEEGIDLLRQKRDNEFLKDNGDIYNNVMLPCLKGTGSSNKACNVSRTTSTTLTQCSNLGATIGSNCKQYLRLNNGVYGYSGSTVTNFWRAVQVEPVSGTGPNNQFKVTSHVGWMSDYGPSEIELTTYLFNWHQ